MVRRENSQNALRRTNIVDSVNAVLYNVDPSAAALAQT